MLFCLKPSPSPRNVQIKLKLYQDNIRCTKVVMYEMDNNIYLVHTINVLHFNVYFIVSVGGIRVQYFIGLHQ